MKMIKKVIKSILPKFAIRIILSIITRFLNPIKEWVLIKKQPKLHEKALNKVKKKAANGQKIKVVFFALVSSVWKYEGVYRLLEKDERFEPIVVVCPVVNYGRQNMLYEMEKAYRFFKEKGYNVVRTYNEEEDEYLDVKQDINPDIVFYANPYKGLIDDRYFITEFRDRLTCYVPYSYYATESFDIGGELFYNLLWAIFCETEWHIIRITSFQRTKGRNLILSGYPGCFPLKQEEIRAISTAWKMDSRKRIIWAPHWLPLEDFLRDATFMLEIAMKFSDKIQLALKPHPLINTAIIDKKIWTKMEMNEYFEQWEKLENTFLVVDDYKNLFWTSDALIHNSTSFLTEYLVTGKPCAYITKNLDYKVKDSKYSTQNLRWNAYGEKAISMHYILRSQTQIVDFINKVVLEGDDYKKESREEFIDKVILKGIINKPEQTIYEYLTKNINFS